MSSRGTSPRECLALCTWCRIFSTTSGLASVVMSPTSNFADVGDITTLANPEVVEKIRHQVQSAKHSRGEVPRELTEAEEAEISAFGSEG